MVRIRFPPAVSRQTIGSSAAEPHLPCPVREEIYRVAARLQLNVFVVFNGSRPIGPPGSSNVHMVLVGDTADAADDWIAEHISAADVCVTSDIPLASRCLKQGARVVSSTSRQWTRANIGNFVGR